MMIMLLKCCLPIIFLLSYLNLISGFKGDIINNDVGLTVCEKPSPTLELFVEELTFPPLISCMGENADQHLTLGAFKIKQKVHRDLPNTTFYAYGTSQATATYPGPTLLVKEGVPLHVRWENHIPDESHFLGIDNAIPWANPSKGGVPMVTHLHGGEVESTSDGHPDAWYTPLNETGPTYEKNDYTYANAQSPSALWYHDHTLGITRLNLIAGLMGFYIFRDSMPKNINIENKEMHQESHTKEMPYNTKAFLIEKKEMHQGSHTKDMSYDNKAIHNEVHQELEDLPVGLPLLIKDMRFLPNGSIYFPFYVNVSGTTRWCAEYGDTMLVNGNVAPFLRVLPQQYRFRLLNACNGRFLELTLSNPTLYFLKIGTDGGFLQSSKRFTTLLFSPGERLDILLDFSSLEDGSEVVLINTAAAPFPVGKLAYSTNGTFYVMKFIVDSIGGIREGLFNSTHLTSLSLLTTTTSDTIKSYGRYGGDTPNIPLNITTRTFTMRSFYGKHGEPNHLILDNRTWSDPVTDFPLVGSTEVWELINLGYDAHNMHIHLINFQVLNTQSFLVENYENESCAFDIPYPKSGSCFTDLPRGPNEGYGEVGWKDTIIAWPGNVTRLLLHFTSTSTSSSVAPFPFDPTLGPGYLWHCHTTDHEDYEMMRPFQLHFPSVTSSLYN